MKITFHGGAGGVTGSKHLIDAAGERILLDCGTFQGHRREARELNSRLPFDPASINAVVLTHGHLDHCGLLPLMFRSGYTGRVYGTAATRDVVEWILKDAAHIQAMDADYMNRHRIEGAELAGPLFTQDDVRDMLEHYVSVPYARERDGWFQLTPHAKLKLYDAGHILGSAVSVLSVSDGDKQVAVGYSGDLGRKGAPLLPDPEMIRDNVDALLLESTYGARHHDSLRQAVTKLAELIRSAVERKAKIIMPAFALGRTQELIYVLHRLTDRGEIPRLPVYVDSPLATSLTDVCTKYPETYDEEAWQDFGKRGHLPLAFRNLSFTVTTAESKALNAHPGPLLIISASGMCEAGRILHHLANSLSDPKNLVLITGFQAEHTLGRRLVDGAAQVRIFGNSFPVRAEIQVLNEFSAHADQAELADYAEQVPGVKQVFLVHGEKQQAHALKRELETRRKSWRVHIPERGEEHTL